MDFSITKTSSRIETFQLGTFLTWLLRMGLFGFLIYQIMQEWTFMTLTYTAYCFYIITKEFQIVRNILKKVKKDKEKGYIDRKKIKIDNPRLNYGYKSLIYFAVLILLKATATYFGYTNTISFTTEQEKEQLLKDFEINLQLNNFNFNTLLQNLNVELIIIGLLVLILLLEKKVLKYYQYDFDQIKKIYSSRAASIANVCMSLSILVMPIIESSPFTMIPVVGYITVLILIYYIKDSKFVNYIWIPKFFTIFGCLIFTLCKIQSISLYSGKKFGDFANSMVFISRVIENELKGNIFVFMGFITVLCIEYYKDCQAQQAFKKIINKRPTFMTKNEEHPADKQNSMFSKIFRDKFDAIMRLDTSKQIKGDDSFKYDYIEEIKELIDLKKYKEKCKRSRDSKKKKWTEQTKIFFEKFWSKLKIWIKEGASKFVDLMIRLFSNSMVLLLGEVIIASFFVVFVDVSFTVVPIIIWIFTNLYTELNSKKAMTHKIVFLLVPTTICSAYYKIQYHKDRQSSGNPDFDFSTPEKKNLVFSVIGLVLIAVVIMELVAQMLKVKPRESNEIELEENKNQNLPDWILFLVNIVVDNSVYFVAINLYVISININILNYFNIIFLCAILLSSKKSQKCIMAIILLLNQSIILLRYFFAMGTDQFSFFEAAEKNKNLVDFWGLKDKETLGFRSVKIKIALNYSLQFFVFLYFWSVKNKKQFEYERDKNQTVQNRSYWSNFYHNLKDLLTYCYFHCLPWIAYIAIMVLLVYSPCSILSLVQFIFIGIVLNQHIKKMKNERFGGIDKMRGSWRFLIIMSVIKALIRYTLWFSVKPFLQEKFNFIKTFHDSTKENFEFIGFLPDSDTSVFLEILPEFLTMFFGSLIKSRMIDVDYSIKNEDRIRNLDLPDRWTINVNEMVRSHLESDNEKEPEQDVEDELIELEKMDKNEKKKLKYLMYCRKRVFGDIWWLKSAKKGQNSYRNAKFWMSFNFLFAVWLSTFFKLSVSMGIIVFGFLKYYWKIHGLFAEEADNKQLDTIIKRRLAKFYNIYLTKPGLESCVSEEDREFEKKLENYLFIFTNSLNRTELKLRRNTWSFLRVFLIVCLIGQYTSYFLQFIKLNVLSKWLNLGYFMMGWNGYSKNRLADIYGYHILIILLLFEMSFAKKLKKRLKEERLKLATQDESSLLTGGINKNFHRQGTRLSFKSQRSTFRMGKEAIKSHNESIDLSSSGTSMMENQQFMITMEEDELEVDPNFLNDLETEEEMKEDSIKSEPKKEIVQHPAKLANERIRLAKLIFFHQNKTLYLNCKLYYACITLMSRFVFFILLYVYDAVDSIVSFLVMITVAYFWYKSSNNAKKSVQSVNLIIGIVILLKYFIALLDLNDKVIVGEKPTFDTSVVLIFLTKSSSMYKGFHRIINDSLEGYWLVLECCVFVVIQLLMYLYCAIMKSNSSVLRNHALKVKYMLLHSIPISKKENPLRINFKEWRTGFFELFESMMKLGAIYLPILVVLFIAGSSQYYASAIITIVIVLSIFLIYMLAFKWLMIFVDKLSFILRYYSWIQLAIWIYLIWGVFTRAILGYFFGFPKLYRMTFIVSFGLVSFQLIKDLWTSKEFQTYYNSVKQSAKFRSLAVPLAKAYRFNDDKLGKLIEKLKIKGDLDYRIDIMEKQLKLWQEKFRKKNEEEEEMTFDEKEVRERQLKVWEDEIKDLNAEEADIEKEIAEEDELFAKVGFFDKILTKLQIYFYHKVDTLDYANNLELFQVIRNKNKAIMEVKDFGIYDYITDNISSNYDIIEKTKQHYEHKDRLTESLREETTVEEIRESKVFSDHLSESSDKDRTILHSEATNTLFENLTMKGETRYRKTIINEESNDINNAFLMETCDEFIQFYNLSHQIRHDNFLYRYSKFQQFSQILTLLPAFLYSQWKNISLILVILYCLFQISVAKVPLLIYVIMHGLTEERNIGRKFWNILFFYICGMICIKYSLKSFLRIQLAKTELVPQFGYQLSSTQLSIVQFLFGNISFDFFEVIALFAIIVRSIQAQFSGLFEKSLLHFENINQAFVRVKINKMLMPLWRKSYKEKMMYIRNLKKRLEINEAKSLNMVKTGSSDFAKTEGKFNLKTLMPYINNYNRERRDYLKFKKVILATSDHFEKQMMTYNTERIDIRNWRVFSKYVRKPGGNYYFATTSLQILLALYIFLFFQNMERTAESISDSFANNQFSGKMTVFLFIQMGIITFDRYLFLLNPRKWRDWQMFRFKKEGSEIKKFEAEIIFDLTKGLEDLPLKVKFKRIVRRLIIVRRLLGCTGTELSERLSEAVKQREELKHQKDPKVDYENNPLYKKFNFQFILMIFIYSTTFIFLPLSGNSKITGSNLCNSLYLPISKQYCNYATDNFYIWFFFVIYTIYFILSALQIRDGENFLKNQRKSDRRWTNTSKYFQMAVLKTPFIFEIKTCLDFSVTETSLGIFQWFKFEDTFNNFFTAKFAQIDSDKRRMGQAQTGMTKILFGWLLFAFFMVVLFGPLFLFSSFNPISRPNKVGNMILTLGVQIKDAQFELFSNSHPKYIGVIDDADFLDYFNDNQAMINFNPEEIQIIEMYPFSDKSWEVTVPMYDALKNELYKALSMNSNETRLYYKLELEQVSGPTTFTNSTIIQGQQILDIHEVLTKCTNTKIVFPSFYYMLKKTNFQTGPKDYKEAGTEFEQSISLSVSCKEAKKSSTDDNNQNQAKIDYWMVSTQNSKIVNKIRVNSEKKAKEKESSASIVNKDSKIEEQGGIVFIAILDKYSKAINSIFASVTAVYTGFVLLLGNILKGVFTNQSTKIWLTDVPSAEQIIRICEGITAARIDGELEREERLYWELIDIMRSPEMVKMITQKYLKHKLELEEQRKLKTSETG